MRTVARLLDEPSLVAGSWIRIETEDNDRESKVITSFKPLLSQTIKDAKSQKLTKIEVNFPYSWSDFPKTLKSQKFFPALNLWHYPIPANPPSACPTQISNNIPPFKQILPLIREQADYHHHLYPDYYRPFDQINPRYFTTTFRQDKANPNTLFLFYTQDNDLRGFLQGQFDHDNADIWELIVAEKFRGQGIGSALLSCFIQNCQAKSIKEIHVETGYNQPAVNFYQKLGFTPVSQTWYRNL